MCTEGFCQKEILNAVQIEFKGKEYSMSQRRALIVLTMEL